MENTINNVKNSHNRQISYDPQNQQPFNESYSKRKLEDVIVEVDNIKISNKSNENNNHNDDNEGKYKSKSNTIENNLLHQSSSKIMSSLPRRKSSVLEISSLLCSNSTNLSVYDSPSSSVDEDSSMDDVSSHLGDTVSLGSPNNSSTPATTPPYSPSGGTATTTITIDQEKRLFKSNDDTAFVGNHSQHDLQTQQRQQQHCYNSNNSNNHYSQQQLTHHHHQENERYMEQGRSQEETIWKRPRPRLVLPSISSFTSVPNLRSDSNNENSNGQFIYNQSSSPDHGKINSPVDHHSPQKSWNHLEQFALLRKLIQMLT